MPISQAAATIAGAAIGTGGTFLGNLAGAGFNKRQQERANKATRKNMEMQHQFDLDTMYQQQQYAKENFKAENERQDYLMANAKRIEMQALRDAGLNPSLAGVGNGYQAPATQSIASPVGLASSAPVSSGYTPLNFSGLGADALNGALTAATINKLKEETRKTRIENDNTESQNATFADLADLYGVPVHDTGSFNAVKLYQEGAQQYLNRKELEETAELRRKQAEIWNNDPEMQNEWKQSVINLYKQLGDINAKIKAETGKTFQEILNLKEGVKYTRQQIKESISRVDKNTQDILVGIMQEAKMSEEINTMETQRRLSQNMDYATILRKESEANEVGDKEEAEFWHSVLMYRSHNYENLVPAGIYSVGNLLGAGLSLFKGKAFGSARPIGFVGH